MAKGQQKKNKEVKKPKCLSDEMLNRMNHL